MTTTPEIHGPTIFELCGRRGYRYWVQNPHGFVSRPDVDLALASFPLAVFVPERNSAQTPILIGLQGMAAPYQWNAFLIPHLLDAGIACVLFDTPLSGERSLIRDQSGDILRQLLPLVEKGISPTIRLVEAMFEGVASDIALVLDLLRNRHGLTDERIALMGVSLGCLLSSFAFLRDGVGQRLLGVIGHADLQAFARSYSPYLTPLLASSPAWLVARAMTPFIGAYPQTAVEFLAILSELSAGGATALRINPMSYADRIGPGRRVRFLVGQEDNLLSAEAAVRCAGVFPEGECYVVPHMGHGVTSAGDSFEDHVRYYVSTQLGDWRN